MLDQSTSVVGRVEEDASFNVVKDQLEAAYPGYTLSRVRVTGETHLGAEHGGTRIFWLYAGEGEVWLPAGYRTQEGDGQRLPETYQPEPMTPEFAALLEQIEAGLDTLGGDAADQVRLILARRQGGVFRGDVAAQLWALEHLPRPWSKDAEVERALVALFTVYRSQGFSVKQTSSFERIMAGDQLAAHGDEEIRVRGDFACLTLEKRDQDSSQATTARRLRFLIDTAGGCSFDFDPVRRLPLTWCMDQPGQPGDGGNFVNAHVVNIPEELSSTHFHPPHPSVGGLPQAEMYLVLDPGDYGIVNKDRAARILLFPDLRDLRCFEKHPLEPGDLVYIPPGVGHRGLDVFVNVLTIPGFKPHNEIYIDQDIRDLAAGDAPYNEAGVPRKNYERIEDFFP